MDRCSLCWLLPTVTYDVVRALWIVGCQCSRAVKVCDKGHVEYEEALVCWSHIVAEIRRMAA